MEALIVIFLTGLISLFIAFAKKPALVLATASTGLIVTIALFARQLYTGTSLVNISYQGLEWTKFSLSFGIVVTIFTLLIISVGYERFREEAEHTGEYIGLLIFSLCGAVIMTAFSDMFMFFLGLEILSIPIYVMAGSKKLDLRSNEAALKYFLTGAFATGIFLFGMTWIYGATGTFNIYEIGEAVQGMTSGSSMLFIGILLIMSSFIFKVGAAPFHFWSPDVYDGSPYAVTGFMAAVVKMAAFGAFTKMFFTCFGSDAAFNFWAPAIAVLAVITMFVGNLSALRQNRVKRMLAYSSITHVGYTLLVLVAGKMANGEWTMNYSNLWFYMMSYGFSIIAIITVGVVVNDESDSIEGLKGLGKRNPLLAVVLFVAVLSLAGIPITAGFFGKYMVFSAAWTNYSWLVIVALVNSAISIYYYLRLLGVAASKDENNLPAIKLRPLTTLVLIVCLAAMLGLGFLSDCLISSLT